MNVSRQHVPMYRYVYIICVFNINICIDIAQFKLWNKTYPYVSLQNVKFPNRYLAVKSDWTKPGTMVVTVYSIYSILRADSVTTMS